MIGKFAQQFSTGIKQGFRTRDFAFLGILAIGLSIPLILLSFTAWNFGQGFSWQLIVDIGTPFWFSVLFSFYIIGIKVLQVYHQHDGNPEAIPKLARQFDVVVFFVLIVLIAGLMIK
ncbi:hypothetical protein [Pseudomonas serbica]|uniref:hypothetical protein n=1 Tax=Pseudomonas serbica TaxID=2965074 RepID=UPI00237BF943|nr:hypothetical protein [Pseudomonas serbica]